MIVQLKAGPIEHAALTVGQLYSVIGIEANSYRILNDHGKPYLFEAELFDVIDPHEPEDWVTEVGTEGERYAYPAALNRPGFFEDFFEGDVQTVSEFWRVVNQRLSRAA